MSCLPWTPKYGYVGDRTSEEKSMTFAVVAPLVEILIYKYYVRNPYFLFIRTRAERMSRMYDNATDKNATTSTLTRNSYFVSIRTRSERMSRIYDVAAEK